jgi:uncharacterized protein (TIGR03435 family)
MRGQSAATQPVFDVASVKPNTVGINEGPGRGREETEHSPLSLTMRNVRLSSCMKWAYDVNDYQISGPDWINLERYDIAAKTSAPATEEQLKLMLRALLAERFKLTFHRQQKELQTFALTVGKNGPKLQESTGEGESLTKGNQMSVGLARTTMAQFAEMLSSPLHTPVTDQTGLKGRYDFHLDLVPFIPDECRDAPCGLGVIDMPNIIARAVQEQLGLALEPRKGPVDVLIVDHAEKVPTEN